MMRRLRGFLGTMAVWAVAMVTVGLVSTVVVRGVDVLVRFEFRWLPWAVTGANMGLVFATALVLGERKKRMEGLSWRRFAGWGFLAGASLPVSLVAFRILTAGYVPGITLRSAVVWAGVFGATGAALAVASLGAARRSRGVVV
jgi:hypothetical protein